MAIKKEKGVVEVLKKIVIFSGLICFLLLTCIPTAWSAQPLKIKKVAVLQFASTGGDYSLGSAATDFLVSDLVKMRSCQVVERGELKAVLNEQQLNATGMISSNTAVKLGGILGLDYLVMGTVSGEVLYKSGYYYKEKWVKPSYTTKVKVIAKLVDTRNGEIVWSDQRENEDYTDESTSIDMKRTLEETVYDMARRIYESYLPLQGYVIKNQGTSFVLDLGQANNVKVGDCFLVTGIVEAYRHPVTGELITDIKTKGKLKVVSVSERLCVADWVKDDKIGGNVVDIQLGDVVAKQISKKPKGFLGIGWSGKHEF